MAQEADLVSKKERRLGGLSLILLAAGVVGRFSSLLAMILPNPNRRPAGVDPVAVAIGFRVVFVLLALVLGIFGRRSRAGRVGLLGSAALLGIVLILVLILLFRPAVRRVSTPSLAPPTIVFPIP